MKNFSSLLTILLVVSAIATNSGCQSLLRPGMPSPPKGELGVHNQPKKLVFLSDLSSSRRIEPISIESTNRWVMFSPTTWESIMNYLNALERALGEKSGPVVLSTSEVRQAKEYLRRLKSAADHQGGN